MNPRSRLKRFASSANPGRVLRSRPVRDFFWMTVGILLAAWALDAFLIPNKVAPGGVSGLATVIYYGLRPLNLPWTPTVGVQMLVFNLILLTVGIRVRGWRYGGKTIFGAVGLSLAIDALAPITPHLGGSDLLLSTLWGGALMGLGMGIVFRVGGNTGGTDIVAQLLSSKIPLGVGQLMLIIDALVVVAAGVVLGPNYALYAAVGVVVMGTAIDIVGEGLVTEKAVYIFSLQSEPIGQAILHELGRGATAFPSKGLYTGQDRDVIFTVVSRTEVDGLKSIVHALDPEAFVVISDVHEALGEGFKEYRVR